MMKKWTALLLAVLMLLGAGMAAAETPAAQETIGGADEAGTKVTVGMFTRPSGAFFTEMWGNSSADSSVRALIHGQSTVAWTNNGQYAIDPTVVKAVSAKEHETKHHKTYRFTLNDDLVYSDGTPITAADYVFSILLQSAPALSELGAEPMGYVHLLGGKEYATGKAKTFSGVHLIGKYSFELTIGAKHLPYFYELTYVNVTPYPIGVIAPGCTVGDDGNGAYIKGGLDAALLRRTILDPETGYLSHPAVTSGPYTLIDYDAASGSANFRINPYYPGNYEGVKPAIESLALREAKYDTALAELADGTLDIVHQATDGDFVRAAKAQAEAGACASADYLRSGYGFLSFACEEDVTGDANVRRAMAMCMDRDALIHDFLGENGMPVYSYYGLGQWMAQPYVSTMQEHVKTYPFDAAAAIDLLERDGWIYNARGRSFVPGEGAVRHKKVDGEFIPLQIRYAQLKDNQAAQWITDNYVPILREAGFGVDVTEVTFDELLRHYYRQTERTYNLMFLATNFTLVFDPYFTFNPDKAYQNTYNTTGIRDEVLFELAQRLRRIYPDQKKDFERAWLRLMNRFSEVLPTLPLYSNVYHDFYNADLQGYEPGAHWSWPAAILYSSFAE